MTKLISHVLASDVGCCVTEWAQSISLRHMEGQIPVLIHVIQQTLSEVPERHIYVQPVTV